MHGCIIGHLIILAFNIPTKTSLKMEVNMTRVLLAVLAFALTLPAWAQRGQRTPPAASNQGATTTGLNQASQVQSNNPTGADAKGLTTAEKNAALQAGGQGQGAAHAKKGKKSNKSNKRNTHRSE